MIRGRGIRLFKHLIIDDLRHTSCKYLHLLCMGIWALKDTNSTISQGLVLVAPKACILLISLILVNYHYTIFYLIYIEMIANNATLWKWRTTLATNGISFIAMDTEAGLGFQCTTGLFNATRVQIVAMITPRVV